MPRADRPAVLWSQSISRGDAGKAYALNALNGLTKPFHGQLQRPDLEAMVASGLFDECASAVAAVAAAGVEGLHDTDHQALSGSLMLLRNCRGQPGCEAKIRQLAPALAFCLEPEHDLDFVEQLGQTTGSTAAQICTRYPKLSHRVRYRAETHSALTIVHFLQAAGSSAETKAAQSSPSRSSMSTYYWTSGRKSCERWAGGQPRSPRTTP